MPAYAYLKKNAKFWFKNEQCKVLANNDFRCTLYAICALEFLLYLGIVELCDYVCA